MIKTLYFEDIILERYFKNDLYVVRNVDFYLTVPETSGLNAFRYHIKMKGTADDVLSVVWRYLDPSHSLGQKIRGSDIPEEGATTEYKLSELTISERIDEKAEAKAEREQEIKETAKVRIPKKQPRDKRGHILPSRIGAKYFSGGFWRSRNGRFVRLPRKAR